MDPTPSDVDRFVYLAEQISVDSSNLSAAQFFLEDRYMVVWFKNGGSYLVEPVSEFEAVEFFHSGSKGEWYWDNVRVRGTRYNHQKTVKRIS